MYRLTILTLIFLLISISAFSQISWVTSLKDDTTSGTLRYAVNHAATGAEIRFADSLFANGSDTLRLDSTIYITDAISIRGYMRNGDTLFVSGNSSVRIFDVDMGFLSTATKIFILDSMALIDGFSSIGGAMQLHFLGPTEITNCYFKNNSSTYGGGVIDCDLSGINFHAHLRFDNNTFIQNAGLRLVRFLSLAQIRMNHNYFNNNNTSKCIHATTHSGKLIAENIHITNNYKINPFGANMLLTFNSDTLLTDSLFVMNNTEAGAFEFGGQNQYHTNLYAINNTQQNGAGALEVYWTYSGIEPPLFENCVFKNNAAGRTGAMSVTSITMRNSIIRGNTSTANSLYGSGAVQAYRNAYEPLSFINCVIDSNITTQGPGGAIYGETEHLYLERVSIYENHGGNKGGGVVLTDCDSLTILNSYIGDNTAYEHAGVHLGGNSFARIENTTVCNNTATQGTGGLNSLGTLEISGTLILNNIPTNFGTSNYIPTFTSKGYNLIDQNLPSSGVQQTDIINPPAVTTPMSSLTDNGGIGLTRMPLAGNLAINLGDPSDASRPFNDTIRGGTRDIGGVENNDSVLKSFTTVNICDSILIGGSWRTRKGFFVDSAKSAQNTDSIAIIKINKIHHSIRVVDVQKSCDSIVWIDGQTYYPDNNTATVSLTSRYGCDSIVTLDLSKTRLDTGLTVTGSNIQLNLTNALIQWYSCDSALQQIPNATSATFTPPANGNYLAILEKDACTDTTQCVKFTSDIGLLETSLPRGIQVFPNPSSGLITISWTEEYNPVCLRVYKMDGQLVNEISHNRDHTSTELSLDGLPPGSYIILAKDLDQTLWKTVIIKD